MTDSSEQNNTGPLGGPVTKKTISLLSIYVSSSGGSSEAYGEAVPRPHTVRFLRERTFWGVQPSVLTYADG